MKNAKLLWRILGYVLIPALFFCFGGGSLRAQDTYTKVTSDTELTDGEYLIGTTDGTKMLGVQAKNNRTAATIANSNISGSSITTTVATATTDNTNPYEITITKTSDNKYTLVDKVAGKYLHNPEYSGSSNYLRLSDSEVKWTIEIAATGVATIKMADVTGRTWLRFNSTLFACYSSGQSDVSLYKKQAATNDPFVKTAANEVSYKILPTETLNKTLSFTAGNLTSDLTVSVASATGGTAVISVDKSTVSKETTNFDLTLTTSTLAEGEYSDIITIKSGAETMATVTVNLTVALTYPYKKITTDAELTDGGKYLIVNEDNDVALSVSSTTSTKYQTHVGVTITDGTIEDRGAARELTFEKSGEDWKLYDADANEYLYYTGSKNELYAGATADTWTIGFDGLNAVITNKTANKRVIRYNSTSNQERFACYEGSQEAIQLYKKSVPETPTCGVVTMPGDGGVTPTKNSVSFTWNAPNPVPANGYRITVSTEGSDKTETVEATATHYDWGDDLTPATIYNYSIVSICGENLESEAVTGSFETLAAGTPTVEITAPANNAVLTGDVTVTFTLTDFELDATHLVKAEVKEQATNQAAAPVLKRLYTQASSFTISGLEDGNYHVDLYMVEVNGTDTTVVGFNGSNYVHRNFVVKHPSVTFSPKSLELTGSYQGTAVSGKVNVVGWELAESSDKVSVSCPTGNFSVSPVELTRDAVMAEGGAEITVTYNGALTSESVEITLTYGTMTDKLSVSATTTEVVELTTLAGLYSGENDKNYRVTGKMVVTHKDSYNNRIWVQDINKDKENGASMLLFKASNGYDNIQVGDVLENVLGKLTKTNQNLYQITPVGELAAVENNHAIYVDTLTVAECHAKIASVQSALVCVERVHFTGTGTFTEGKALSYPMAQGEETMDFYTTFTGADYMGKAIPAGKDLNITGILGIYKEKAQISARNEADMVEAPCLVPTDIQADAHVTEATIDWDGLADKYSVRYAKTEAGLESATAVEVDVDNFTAENLDAETTYYYQVKSVCGATNESEWSAVKSFTTLSATVPSIRIVSPGSDQKFTDSVKVSFRVSNVTLKAEDTSARIVFSDGFTVDNYTDTVYKRALPTGSYSVRVELWKANDTLTPNVRTQSRKFSVDLPDVAKPVFAPAAGRYKDSVEVTLTCGTQGASIFYAKGEGEWVAYTEGDKIVLKESATLKAFACKERMDTSAVATAAYTVYSMLKPVGDLVFHEYFDNIGGDINSEIKDINSVLPGWSGTKVYPGAQCLKMGTGSAKGSVSLPKQNLSYDNGKYFVVFTAQAWKNDATTINLIAGDETVSVTDLDKSGVYDAEHRQEYVFEFTNGTAETQITFEAVNDKSNRFFIDSVRIYQVLPSDLAMLTVTPATVEMNTVQGTPVSKKVTVTGRNLAADVTVTCPEGNFSVSAATLTKEAVMGENGAELTVTFNGAVASDNVTITLASGELTKTIEVTATAATVTEVDNIAALRAGTQGTLYKVTGEVVVTAMDTYRNYKWIQDATGAILIDDQTGYVTNTYAVGDGITGVYGKLGAFGGQLQLIMTGNLPEASSHGNAVEPEVVTVEELTENIEKYCSRLVRINGLTLTQTEGTWVTNEDHWAVNADEDSVNIRTFVRNGSYIGEALPEGEFDLIALAGIYNNAVQVSPRVKEDIITGGVTPDECEAPTNLKATTLDRNVTLEWNGTAAQYHVVVLLGNDTVRNERVAAKSLSLQDLEVGTYSWAVASVCEDGEQWTAGNAFEIKKSTANEGAAGLAFRLYPNPTADVFYVEVAEGARMEIFTVGGVLVRGADVLAGKTEIRLDWSGIYFVRLTNARGTAVQRVVVR